MAVVLLIVLFCLEKPVRATSPVPVQCSIGYAQYWQLSLNDLANILRSGPDPDGRCAGEAMMDKYPSQAIPMLLKWLKEPNAYIRKMAVSALSQPNANGKHRKEVLSALIGVMADPNDDLLYAAIESLRVLGFDAKDEDVVRAMLGSIESGRSTKFMAAYALANTKSLPAFAVARLAHLTEIAKDDPNMRATLLEALTKTGLSEAASIVADNLLRPDTYSEYRALRAIAAMEQTAVPPLVKVYPDASLRIQIDILNTFKVIDASVARDAVHQFLPALLQRAYKLIGDSDLRKKREGFVVLRNLGELVRPALPTLIAALNDPNATIRGDAADVLRDSEIVEALPQLRRVAEKDPDKLVRQAAALAVGQINSSEGFRKSLEACISPDCEKLLGSESVKRTRAKMRLREELKRY